MIKKLNIALAAVFAAMIVLKMLVSLKSDDAAPSGAEVAVLADDPRSSLEPHVYFDNWPPFACRNYLSNRNGVVLDIVRAIFPKATFIEHTNVTNDMWKIEQISKDPLAVVVTMGKDAQGFEPFPCAPTPLAWYEIRLITLRSNPWRYKGPDSLKSLRIAADRYSMDNDVTLDLEKRGLLKVRPVETLQSANVLSSGEADAIVECCWSAVDAETSQLVIDQCRRSEPLGRAYVHFRTATNDVSLSQALIRDFEAGFKRIKASGEHHRICEYYGFSD